MGIAVPGAFAAGCGGDDDSNEVAKPPARVLVGARDLNRYRSGRVERALLDYWASLQFHAWPQAISFLDPRLRDILGTARLAQAFEQNAGQYQATAPEIVDVKRRGRITTVAYRIRQQEGERLESSSWVRERGEWRIIFDSMLNPTLRVYVQTTVNGSGKNGQPSERATRAADAVGKLQARFLARQKSLLDPSGPRKP